MEPESGSWHRRLLASLPHLDRPHGDPPVGCVAPRSPRRPRTGRQPPARRVHRAAEGALTLLPRFTGNRVIPCTLNACTSPFGWSQPRPPSPQCPFAFGKSSKPSGTTVEYRKVDAGDQWCGRSTSPHHNSWMDAPNKSCPAHAAKVLSDYSQDNDAAVIGYNTKRTPKRGSAIILHTHGKGSTAGCVSVTTAQAKTLLRWMDPEKTPRIVIAP